MTLEGAINLNETNDYVIYTMNSVTTGQYGVVVPKNIVGTLNMLIDLNMKSTFDGVGNGTKTKEQLVEEISGEYNKLRVKYSAGMLVMPMMDSTMFSNIVNNGDKQKMFDEVKKIGAITSELYKKLTDSGIDKQKIDQKIIIVEKKTEDIKFVDWLRVQMPNFVDGVLYSEFNGTNVSSVPVDNNNIFTSPMQEVAPKVEEQVAPVTPVSSGIFDNIPPVASTVVSTDNVVEPIVAGTVAPEEPAMAVTSTPAAEPVVAPVSAEPVSVSNQLDFGNIFETNANVSAQVPSVGETSVSQPAEVLVSPVVPVSDVSNTPVVETAANLNQVNNDVFNANNNVAPVPPVLETPVSQAVENPTSPVNNDVFGVTGQNISGMPSSVVNSEVNNVVSENSNVEGPKPVASAPLDGTMTFTSVVEQAENPNGESTIEGEGDGNKSKGFVNLAILLVVIVAITFVSIEIGKYLYNVFGA